MHCTQDPEAYTSTYLVSTKGPEEVVVKKTKKEKKVAAEEGGEADEFLTVGKGGKSLDLSKEGLFKTLKTIQEARGRKVRNISWEEIKLIGFI